MAKMRGFTLMELMIVVAIVALLSAIAYPAYQDQVRKSNRSDAKAALSDVAQKLERCYTTFGVYNSASCGMVGSLGGTVTSPEGYYTIAVSNHTATTYTLTATPAKPPQTGDTTCPTLTLNELNERGPTGCW